MGPLFTGRSHCNGMDSAAAPSLKARCSGERPRTALYCAGQNVLVFKSHSILWIRVHRVFL